MIDTEIACPKCRMLLDDSHLGACVDCGALALLGWEHLCRGCAGAEEEETYRADERYELQCDAEFTRLEELADQRDAMLDTRGVYDDREF